MTKLKALLAKKDSNKGFTLMEMIIVIAIIAILIALIAPNLISYLDTANETKRTANAKVCYTSANAWVAQMKVKGKSIPNCTITYESGKNSNKASVAGATIDGTITAVLDDSIDCGKWASEEKCVLTFDKGVCTLAVYTSDGKEGKYPQ